MVECHAKCIISGEHTVLRGGQAIVCPLKTLTVQLYEVSGPRGIWVKAAAGEEKPFPGAEEFLSFLEKIFGSLTRRFILHIDIPLGVGLGGSAALSVAFARLLEPLLSEEKLFELANQIEHFFHGQSSGVDVAGVMAQGPLVYQANPPLRRPLKPAFIPRLFLSKTKEQGSTQKAIQKIAILREKDKIRANEIDAQMKEATQSVLRGLEGPGGWVLLKEGLNQAGRCFEKWGLITESMHQERETLVNQGASAVKPTGSGLGGVLLSLWDHEPPVSLIPVELIPMELSA